MNLKEIRERYAQGLFKVRPLHWRNGLTPHEDVGRLLTIIDELLDGHKNIVSVWDDHELYSLAHHVEKARDLLKKYGEK